MNCRRFVLFFVFTYLNVLPAESRFVSAAGCRFCEPGALCLDWDRAWLESYQPGLNTGWDFRIQLADLQTVGREKLIECGGGGPNRVSHALVHLPLAELLPSNFGSSGGGSPLLYEFFLAPSGKVANLSGIKDKQGAMVLGHAKHQQACAHFSDRLPSPNSIATRLCGAAQNELSLSLLLVPGANRGQQDNLASACGFCSKPDSLYFDSAIADLTAGGHWKLLLPIQHTTGLEITASLFTAASDLDADCPFRCDNHANCIGWDRVCDERSDCDSGADEEVSFCSEIRQQKTDSAPSRQPRTVWWVLGISIAIVILLALVLIQTALLVVRHKNCASHFDASSDASSEISREFSSGSGGINNASSGRSRRQQQRRREPALASRASPPVRSEFLQRLLAGRTPSQAELADNPAPPPVVLSQQRLFEQQQLRRLRQLAGAVPPPPFRQPPPFAGGAPEDSGGEFDMPMPVPAQAGVAQQRPRLEDSGFSGDDLGRCRMAPLGLSQFRSSACVPRLPNRWISPPPQSSRGQKKSSR
ncbi:hypothetical protein BOX15_Mlig021184g2 [Macrostomum lignano]|uniref:MAM domain-containing protein n=2 Tax=Macrostomum lignano TaxID=282301 RepID=A0A267DZE4_9PLAT|nr:hypothetical protein BOX15_Mlig021184g2 [Macrostomum lignano]